MELLWIILRALCWIATLPCDALWWTWGCCLKTSWFTRWQEWTISTIRIDNEGGGNWSPKSWVWLIKVKPQLMSLGRCHLDPSSLYFAIRLFTVIRLEIMNLSQPLAGFRIMDSIDWQGKLKSIVATRMLWKGFTSPSTRQRLMLMHWVVWWLHRKAMLNEIAFYLNQCRLWAHFDIMLPMFTIVVVTFVRFVWNASLL